MTAPAGGILAALNFRPQTQNTAPVIEFRCLYTSDLRRKQKRWQDGRLKFHTFNKRIMVYDDRSNFVGDSHWREDYNFAEGEEVELERCGVLVEVSECVEARDQDLTSLLSRTVKDREGRAPTKTATSSPFGTPHSCIRKQPTHLSPTNPIDLRSTKRKKLNSSPSSKNGYAQSLTGATLALSGTPSTTAPLHYDPLRLRISKQPIEAVGLADSGRIYGRPQQRLEPQSISQNRIGERQAEEGSARLLLARVGYSSVRNSTQAPLLLAGKTSTKLLTPATKKTATTTLCKSSKTCTTIQEGEFIDIDVYGKGHSHAEEGLKTSQAKFPPSPKACPEEKQHLRLFNPLRIRTRPKRKLLLIANPQSRPPSLTEVGSTECIKAICPPTPRKGVYESLPLSATEQHITSVNDVAPSGIKEHQSSSPVNGGMDPHCIDTLLVRTSLAQTSMTKNQSQYVVTFSRKTNSPHSNEKSRIPARMEEPEEGLVSHILDSYLRPKQNIIRRRNQPSMVHGHTDSETTIDCAKPFEVSRTSAPRLVKTLSTVVQQSHLHITTGIRTVSPTYQADNMSNQGVVPFTPPTNLTDSITLGGNFVQRDDAGATVSETAKVPIMIGRGPINNIPTVQAHRDQGPWSREAFDLFDWRPGQSTMVMAER